MFEIERNCYSQYNGYQQYAWTLEKEFHEATFCETPLFQYSSFQICEFTSKQKENQDLGVT